MQKRYTLLIVEDEENILYGMKSVLSGYLECISEVYAARNGKEALEVIHKREVSMIISDLRMPEMDGIEFIKVLRRQGYMMPVIVLTALADFKLAQELIPLKIQNYILKPFSVEEIIQETKNAFEELKEKEALSKAEKFLEEFPEILDNQQKTESNSIIKEVKQYVLEHIKENISLQILAENCHISKAYLSTLFKQEMNITLTEFITRERMKLAKRYLIETDMRVCEIFERTGYQSEKYFIQVFKEREKMTPLAFRKKWKKEE